MCVSFQLDQSFSQPINQFDHVIKRFREVSFFTGRGAPENWGDQVLFLDQKGGSKDFSNKKEGSLIFFKEIKYFVKHFRTQIEFLLILQKRSFYESVSCCNSSKRGYEL